MKSRTAFMSFALLALFLTLAPAASARNTWYVDGVNGSDSNDCLSSQAACKTIGHAISLSSSWDSIMVAPATYTENLTISFSLYVIGSGAATTIVDGGGVATVFTITKGRVWISKLTIRNGYAQSGGGIDNYGTLTVNNSTISGNSASDGGGGIDNYGTLTINNSTISGNNTGYLGNGGGVSNASTLTICDSTVKGNTAYQGGGIANSGTLTVNSSTISGNSLVNIGFGSGLFNQGTLVVNNSTFRGNHGNHGYGGGIYNWGSGGIAAVNNSTFSGNNTAGGAVENDFGILTVNNGTISGNSSGAGVYNWWGTVTLQNSIVAANTDGSCSATPAIISNGYNLSSDSTCNFSGPGDMNNTDPKLGKLGNYGGPTQTIPEALGSPTVDAGNPNGCTDGNGNLLKTDQRGYPRPGKYKTDKRCDMGAYERQTD